MHLPNDVEGSPVKKRDNMHGVVRVKVGGKEVCVVCVEEQGTEMQGGGLGEGGDDEGEHEQEEKDEDTPTKVIY